MATVANGWVRTQERESAAFDRLFLAEYEKVAAIASRVVGDAQEAEDIAQEVFISFYQRHSPEAPYAAPWLYRAAAHSALNSVRGRRRRSRREMEEAVETERLHVSSQASLDPQRAVEEEEQRRELRLALGRLPVKSATILALRYSGLSYSEVAASLGIGIGQVGTLLRRAEAALRKEMMKHETR
jgi:RNA polymerase sigma factor (sigma-70 family)